jgi:hypothetical protein
MRRLESALNVHKDHVSAVLSIDYSPTGREFVTGLATFFFKLYYLLYASLIFLIIQKFYILYSDLIDFYNKIYSLLSDIIV